MSIIHTFKEGWLISHEMYLNEVFSDVQFNDSKKSYHILNGLFNIRTPFQKLKEKPLQVKHKRPFSKDDFTELQAFSNLVCRLHQDVKEDIQSCLLTHCASDDNDNALEVASRIYDQSGKTVLQNVIGVNVDGAKCILVSGEKYLFPDNCNFYCKDVVEIGSYLGDLKYDLIVLDPPWWNKYIRRKKAKTNHGYAMMYNHDLKAIPIEKLLEDNGLVVVWCTNSHKNLEDLKEIFIKWGVHFAVRWFWLKVTLEGDPICNFSEPPGKQPFEQIIIGVRSTAQIGTIPDHKVIFSIPSALHSHKPPLIELLRNFIPTQPKCLELFARYLLPGWTSWGLEAIRFQHESLFEVVI